jgi:hypothetical protein
MKKAEFIKNPLTLIAIFAGVSDVAMTGVLPLLDIEIQKIFIWFVIGYPVLLVCAFFYTLIWKSSTLYAPSDFQTDEAWLKAFTVKDDARRLELIKFEEHKILSKYEPEPLVPSNFNERASVTKFESYLSNPAFLSNSFFMFLKFDIDISFPDIQSSIIESIDINQVPELIARTQCDTVKVDRLKRLIKEFPKAKEDFEALKSLLKGS